MEKNTVTGIVMATMLEAKPFVLGMSLKQSRKKPFALFENDNVFLIISGIGKANAAMATGYLCYKCHPARVYNLGAAGATDFSHALGENFHIIEIIEYDRHKLTTKRPYIHHPDILNGFQTARLSTSDMAVLAPDDRKKISMNADLIDMEGASVAQACRKFDTKCFMFKFVSDTPDHAKDEDIVENIRRHRSFFYEFFIRSVQPVI
ncbi:MAG: adenosylhomocysteine nucleosidase [Desulfobacteraceae bacterium Eth-SRB2]|nr:MAG: adenosylhomocysteine nucleosidase [Desulfobacteraceae bacterium Eth-SRB2]